MAMVTRCPHCATAFRVTAEQLQAHSGHVRCGRCASVFDAFPTLTAMPDTLPVRRIDEPGRDPEGNAAEARSAPATMAGPPQPSWIPARQTGGAAPAPPQIAPGPPAASDGEVAAPLPVPPEPARAADEPISAGAAPEPSANVPSLTDYAVAPQPASRPAGRLRRWLVRAVGLVVAAAAAGAGLWWIAGERIGSALPAPGADATLARAVTGWPGGYLAGLLVVAALLALWLAVRRRPRRAANYADPALAAARLARRRDGAWMLLAALFAATLVVQLAYAWRTELAAHYPVLRPALEAGCRALGCEIGLPRRADALFIDSSDLEAIDDARPNLIRLSATIRNRGSLRLAYPALELTLTDARDRTLARRVFLPAQYLGGADPRAGIAPGAEFSVRLTLDTTDLKPAGYRLFLFYP
jgi:predicted Zn finger-like uncharacterized protein